MGRFCLGFSFPIISFSVKFHGLRLIVLGTTLCKCTEYGSSKKEEEYTNSLCHQWNSAFLLRIPKRVPAECFFFRNQELNQTVNTDNVEHANISILW